MTGTLFNVAGILAGGVAGLAGRKSLGVARETLLKTVLGGLTVGCGLYLVWKSFNGPVLHCLKEFAAVLCGLALGKLTGQLLRLQKTSNRLGRFARDRIAAARPDSPGRFGDGFAVCAVLFCAAPLGILGAIHDGLSGYLLPLAVKGAIDGFAAMSFVAIFGVGVLLSAVPVFVLQSTIALLCARYARPFLEARDLVDPVNAAGGLLIFCVGAGIFDVVRVKKIEVTDYLPSLFFAPLLAHFLH